MLNDTQKDAVRAWVAEGAGLSAVQQRIKDEFGVSMTYMDVRLLVIELNATLQDKPEPKTETKSEVETESEIDAKTETESEAVSESEAEFENGAEEESGMSANVSVTLDRVVRAGALASGDVTFSDGVVGSWFIDRMMRLSFTKFSKDGYQPKRADLEAFQVELQNKLTSGAF